MLSKLFGFEISGCPILSEVLGNEELRWEKVLYGFICSYGVKSLEKDGLFELPPHSQQVQNEASYASALQVKNFI